MSNYLNTDLISLSKVKKYLNQLSVDGMENLVNKEKQSEKLEDIKPLIIEIIESSDRLVRYKLWEQYQDFLRKGEPSLHMLLFYRQEEFITVLAEYENRFVQEQKKYLFTLRISDMTGWEFNQYLQFIGIVK